MTYSLYQLGRPATLSAAESAELAARVASLAASGMPLEAGLLALADELPGQQQVLRNLAARLSRGESFEQASAADDSRLPATLRGLIAAGLRSGRLPQALEEYASLVRRQQAFQQQASLVLIYPALLSCMIAFLLVVYRYYLVDMMLAVFHDFLLKLSPLTAFVYAATPYAMWCMIAISIVFCLAAALPIFLVAVWPFSFLLEYLPVLGAMLRYRRLAASSELLAMLIENNVPAPEALELAAAASDAPHVAADLQNAAGHVRHGETISEALGEKSLPQRIRTLVAWGQTTENVPGALRAAAESFENQIQSRRQLLEVIIAPLFLLLIGGGVGFIILAFMLPLLNLITHLSML